MTRKQKIGSEGSATRSSLLDAAEALMRDEGYAAVTSRRVGAHAGLRAQLVHYYFPTMDEMFLALYRRRADQTLEAASKAMSSENPWLALWRLANDPAETSLNLEFLALANHRKGVRAEIARFTEELRKLQHDSLLRSYAARGLEPRYPPSVITLIISSIGQQIAVEAELGITFAHCETQAVIEETLFNYFDGQTRPEMP